MPPPALRTPPPEPRRRRPRRAGGVVSLMVALCLLFLGLLFLDDRWAPWTPLDPMAPPVAVTPLKLDRATATASGCQTALAALDGSRAEPQPDSVDSAGCHIRQRLTVRALAGATLSPVDTRCDTALRLGLWIRHGVQPAAERLLGSAVVEVLHLGSYACRRIRTVQGPGERMSAHATARAIDIAGVRLADGRRLYLSGAWRGASAEAQFWRAARDGACQWFRTVLGPEFNRLHEDHFHLATGRWAACR